MLALRDQILKASRFISKRYDVAPRIGMILGTGLGDFTEQIEIQATIPYEEIPHFPRSTVETHTGQLVCGTLGGIPVVTMEGRFHFYEGYSMQQVTFPVRVMKELGAEILLTTNASGGINTQYRLADIVIIDDHINLMGDNPLIGINDDQLGPRFPDMSSPYDTALIEMAKQSALELNISAHTGVFVAVPGPNLETRAEYRMLKTMGADIVGMSTVPEVIVATHAGLRTLALSVVTDICLPDALEPVDIATILKVAAKGGEKLARLIPHIVERLK